MARAGVDQGEDKGRLARKRDAEVLQTDDHGDDPVAMVGDQVVEDRDPATPATPAGRQPARADTCEHATSAGVIS